MSCFYKFRDICWNGFLQVVTCTAPQVSFVWFKKVIMWWWISWSLMSESLRSGKLLYSMLSFTLSSKIESKICHREEFNWCKIHHVNKICLKLNILEKFATDVLCTNCGHPCQDDVCHHATIILESCKWNQQHVKWPGKNTIPRSFNRRLGSVVCICTFQPQWQACHRCMLFALLLCDAQLICCEFQKPAHDPLNS